MPVSRYSRLNPRVQSDLASIPIPEDGGLQFSNSIPDPQPYSRLGSPPQSNTDGQHIDTDKPGPRSSAHASNAAGDKLPYTTSPEEVKPFAPKRTRTGNSFYSVTSSAWTTTKQFAISHFNVPKVAAPWEHELSEKQNAIQQPSDTVRYFDHRRQRLRLFVNSSFQLVVTLTFSGGLVGALYGFSTLNQGITDVQKRLFNALVTGLSLCLGLNLGSSLKGYAQMMRWRFLASGYRTIQDFELVMQCDSQSKVFRLLWGGRTRGRFWPNKTQTLAFFWILLFIAVQVFIALLGLTYSIDVSEEYVSLNPGLVSVANVSFIGDANTADMYANFSSTDGSSEQTQAATANSWGVTGQDYTVETMSFDNYYAAEQSIYTDPGNTFYWYRFIDRAASKWSNNVVSSRTVNATATCSELNITYGGYAGYQTDVVEDMFWLVWEAEDGTQMSYWVDDVGTGSTTWMTNMSSSCGPRCIQLYALQSADNITEDVPYPRFWSCLSNVSTVDGAEYYTTPEVYTIPDIQAELLAGAIGFSGFVTSDSSEELLNGTVSDLQMVRYPVDSQWSPPGTYQADDMARLVMKFTAGAIAALDANGPRANVTGDAPGPAQVVKVKWKFSILILAGMPLLQCLVLLLVIMFANKAIIKDTSHLSTARLLRPLVERLGDNGCLLTGDEIAEKLGNFKIIYGVRDPGIGNIPDVGAGDDGSVRHIDILEQSEGLGYRHGRMPVGRYDGMFGARATNEEKRGLLSEQDSASTTTDDDDNASRYGEDGLCCKPRQMASRLRQRRLSI